MKKLIVSGTGFPGTNKTLRVLNESAAEASDGLANICGDKTIVSGVMVAGANCTPGFITFNGELIFFEGGNVQAGVKIETLTEDGNYNQDSSDLSNVAALPAYISKKAVFSGIVGATFLFSDLKRLKTLRDLADTPSNVLTFLRKGTFDISNISFPTTRLISFPDVGTSNYMVQGSIEENDNDDLYDFMPHFTSNHTNTSFVLHLEPDGFVGPQFMFFNYIIIAK